MHSRLLAYKGAHARVVMYNEPDLVGFIAIRDLAEQVEVG
jgi:hypothetical protein